VREKLFKPSTDLLPDAFEGLLDLIDKQKIIRSGNLLRYRHRFHLNLRGFSNRNMTFLFGKNIHLNYMKILRTSNSWFLYKEKGRRQFTQIVSDAYGAFFSFWTNALCLLTSLIMPVCSNSEPIARDTEKIVCRCHNFLIFVARCYNQYEFNWFK